VPDPRGHRIVTILKGYYFGGNMQKKHVSPAIIRRLPRYYRYLLSLDHSGVERVSSKELSELMDVTASQIRQDFNSFGGFGQQGYGYNVKYLCAQLSSILGFDRSYRAIILGAGNLGRALLNNFSFETPVFRFTAAFDVSPNVVGTQINGIPVLAIADLEKYIKENLPDIAVLTVPQTSVLDLCTRLEKTSIKGVWNFTNLDIALENSEIYIENVHFSDSLMNVFYQISRKEAENNL
jgi:redox-sensing transcriptional repressor